MEDQEFLDKENQRKELPFKIFNQIIKYGAGFYVGVRDGAGIPLNPGIKYTLFATPAVLSGSFIGIVASVMSKLAKKTLQSEYKFSLEETLNENKREQNIKEVKKVDYDFPDFYSKIPKAVAINAGKTALKTGVGYVAGYLLSKLIK